MKEERLMQDDEQDIRDLVARWMAATKVGDSETVLDLMADDVVFLVAGQPPFGKAKFAEATAAQKSAGVVFDGRSEIIEITVLGNWAYMLSMLTVVSTQPGHDKESIRSGHNLSILRKQDGNGDSRVTPTCSFRSL